MKLIKANIENIDDIMKIIALAQESMRLLGIDQWQDGYPDRAVILSDIEKSKSYAAVDEVSGQILATAFISFDGEMTYEKIYDGSWNPDINEYAVIHRIAVDSSEKRRGAASFIIASVEKMCAEADVKCIRIDTHEGNFPMQNMLKKNGFSHCGTIFLENGDRRIAFEKILYK